MNRFNKLRTVVALLSVLFVLDIVLIALMIPVRTVLTWCVLAVQVVVLIYFVAIAVGLLNELKSYEKLSDSESNRSERG